MTNIKTYTLEELQTLNHNYTEVDLVVENINLLREQGVEILLESPSLQEDKRYLVPIKYMEKCGFINHMAQVVIQPIYDEYKEDDVKSSSTDSSLIRVAKKQDIVDYLFMRVHENQFVWGVINAKGERVLPVMYRCIGISDTQDVFSVQQLRPFYQYGVRGLYNNEIIPFGRFDNISSFVKGFARINFNNQAIIDLQGNVIIQEGVFDKIWNLSAKYDTIVCEKGGVRYTITFEMLRHLQQEYLTTGQIKTSVEEIMEYQEYLQRDFSNGWETIQIDTNNL